MTRMFCRLLIPRFYSVNAGFFLFVFLIMFGVLPGSETIRLHRGIMEAILHTTPGMCAGLVVLVLYSIKCTGFVLGELSLPQNSFVYQMQGISASKQAEIVATAYSGIFMPLLVYTSLTLFTGIRNGNYVGVACAFAVSSTVIATSIVAICNKINNTAKASVTEKVKLPGLGLKGYWTYLLRYSMHERKMTFVAVKVFSLAALQLMIVLNREQASRENVCFLVLLSIAAHSLLPAYYVKFTEAETSFLRHLPLATSKRILQFVLTYTIILIPELLFLLWNEMTTVSLTVVVNLYLFAIGRLTLYSALQYVRRMDSNRYTGVVFVMFFVSLILLASVNLWVFTVIEWLLAIALFYAHYYAYEPEINTEG